MCGSERVRQRVRVKERMRDAYVKTPLQDIIQSILFIC